MRFHRFLMLLCLSLFIAACGGGGGGSDSGGSSGSSGYGPVADAGAAQTVAMGATVTLDGGASKAGSSGGALTYAWTLSSTPTGSQAGLSSATAANPSFVADVPGTYVARLVVHDGSLGSEPSTVAVTATSEEPVAIVAEPEQNVLIGTRVVLDGSASVPPTGVAASALQYQWTLTEAPAGSSAALADADQAKASVYADVAGTYRARLIVSHDGKVSAPRVVTVTAKASNSAPVAVAKVQSVGGSPASPTNGNAPYSYTIERGQAVTLDASASTDADNDNLTYRWYFFYPDNPAVLIPACSRLSRTTVLTGASPTFTPDAAGNWTVYMVAFDGTSVSATTQVSLRVTKPAAAANTPPEARFLSEGDSHERELGTTVYAFGTSCDIDNDALTRSYEWVSTPPGFVQTDLTGVTGLALTMTHEGDYTIKLTVTDGQGGSNTVQGTFVARTGANVRPVAAVTVDSATVMVRDTAWFDGTGSSDKNGDRLSYAWTLIDRPDGSNATLQGTDSVRARLVPDVAGAYIARLQVTDSLGATGQTTTVYHGKVFAKEKNNAPTVDSVVAYYDGFTLRFWTISNTSNTTLGSAEQPFVAGNAVVVRPNQVVDPDNDKLYYLWTLAQPAGSELTDADSAQGLERTPLVSGDYTATFVASDGVASSSPRSVPFKVVQEADYPSILLKAHGSSFNSTTGQPTFATPVAWPYTLVDQTYVSPMYYTLIAYGGDYTIAGLVTTSATEGVPAPTLEGLTEGQVIRQGERVLVKLVPPPTLSARDARDLVWSFGIKEKPGYRFSYRQRSRDE